jgi:hypothetical protein
MVICDASHEICNHIMSAKVLTVKLVCSEDFSPQKNPLTQVLTANRKILGLKSLLRT